MVDIAEKIIVTDEDTAEEDGRDEGGIYPLDLSNTVINMSESPYSVYEYLRRFDQKRINTQPEFQRKLVWTKGKKSKFIESIILNFPIPAIYLNETIEGTYIVIDGVQRTTALHDFYKNKFELSELEALPGLNGKKFEDLAPAMQAKFEDKKLNIYILKPSTPMPVIYDLFNRINTGGTQLNKQEVRNCIFIGKSTRLLKELAEEKYFIEAIDGGIADTRMKDRETILRYIAFRWFDYKKDYLGSMSDYVEQAMKKINKMDDSRIEEIRADFKRVMEWSHKIWGKENFRIPIQNRRGAINTAILETVCNYLSHKTDDYLNENIGEVAANYYELINYKTYYEAITSATGSKSKVIERFRLAEEILDDYMSFSTEPDRGEHRIEESKKYRNQDKFIFNGLQYKKGPLVWAVVAKYVADNPNTTFSELKEVFPDELMLRYKNYGVFEEEQKAKEKKGRRYFTQPGQVIKLLDKNVVVCTQFYSENTDKIIAVAKRLGYGITLMD